jgi:predicted AAA+ superfamily ATPase
MIKRTLEEKINALAKQYPVITLTGPRQSGKSTLLKHSFPDYTYVSLEDLDMRTFASDDPRGFLNTYPNHTIIDEVQRVPSLLSYIQTHVDNMDETGIYMLAGSQNLLLSDAIGQSLAGRTAVLKLLPFSHTELDNAGLLPASVNDEIFYGSYPKIFDKHIAPQNYYPNYIETYVERDVRLLKNIGNLSSFIRFIKLCAARIGQLLNISSLANECSISSPTAVSWLSILEASYICYQLKPDWNNYTKRLVKSPKLYFYDTGLACALLDIHSASQVDTHYLRGNLFENMVINAFVKEAWNKGQQTDLRFWRDSAGNEVDLLVYGNGSTQAYEIKSSSTFSTDFFKGLTRWAALSGVGPDHLNVIYNGNNAFNTSSGNLVPWETLHLSINDY